MCQRPGIVGTADPEPVSTSMLDLDRALGNASFNDRRFILIQGLIHDLNRKKTWHTRRCQFRVGRKARVMQPFEDQIRIHRIPARDLRDRYARRHRLKTDRPLLLVRPKPLRSTRHPKPRSVHYPWWTLSVVDTIRPLHGAAERSGRTVTLHQIVRLLERAFPEDVFQRLDEAAGVIGQVRQMGNPRHRTFGLC